MCQQCYEDMDKGVVLDQLKESLEKRDFFTWNAVSLNMLVLIMSDETNCEETRQIAYTLSVAYKDWYLATAGP
jgi:hypothetical protein